MVSKEESVLRRMARVIEHFGNIFNARHKKAVDFLDFDGTGALGAVTGAFGNPQLVRDESPSKCPKDLSGNVQPPEFQHIVRIGSKRFVSMSDGDAASPVEIVTWSFRSACCRRHRPDAAWLALLLQDPQIRA
jgi:hypothetical protein